MNSAAKVRVVIADDHKLFRTGLAELLATVPELCVTGHVGNANDLFAINAAEKPDVVLLDVEMPGPGPERSIARVRLDNPRVGVVILTMHDDPGLIRATIMAGANAYLLKSADRMELTAAVRLASRRDDNSVLIQTSRASALMFSPNPTGLDLSPREVEVLAILATAASNRDIASQLHISDATVKRHLTNIYDKLGATSRMDAVAKAQRAGMFPKKFN